jgi:protein-L-isoaspartate O-methyltransferase
MATEERDAIARPASPTLLLPLYGIAIFLSAALLFAVQPMFAKMVLPRFGGAPAVWSVAMVFFQGALLAGYAYAHLLTRVLPGRGAVIVQVALMLAAVLALPLAIASGWSRPPETGAALWLIGLFAVSIGLPFFALAANGPLLQAWFSRTNHPAANNPYFLYAASNIGSFLALVSYPVLIEPFVRLGDQSRLWSAGFSVMTALVALCGAKLWRAPAAAGAPAATDAARPTVRDALTWMALAAVPSGLLVAVTAHISTDVAAVPLLWVVPLALYLLTFVIVFQTRPIIPHRLAVNAQPVLLIALVAVLVLEPLESIILIVAIHAAAFFICALVCHGELARRRPAAQHLTAFYMWMSAGGVIGGLAAGLIAPNAFNWVAEYPILIVLAVLCRPGLALPESPRERLVWTIGVALAAALVVAALGLHDRLGDMHQNIAVTVLLAMALPLWRRPLALAALMTLIFTLSHIYAAESDSESVRSFFGVHKLSASEDGRFRVLTHGTTIHGAERLADINDPGKRPEIIMYYYDGSAIAQAIDAARARAGRPIDYAVVGLGGGTLACRAQAGESVTYYEIDPAIVRIARDRFTYLSACKPDTRIVLGDARLTLADAGDGAYDIIIVDAFSSDAIPIHLLTREAMAIYVKKLNPHGIVVMHVSNRHLELASVVAGIAKANGLVTRVNNGGDISVRDEDYNMVGTVAAVARSDEDFGAIAQSTYWPVVRPDGRQWVWTDDYSNVVGALLRKYYPRKAP